MAGLNPQPLAVQAGAKPVDDFSRYPLRSLFEKSADAAFIVKRNRIIDCNQAALDLLGYSGKADLIDHHPSELGPQLQPDGATSFDTANEMLDLAIAKGNHRFEWVLKCADDRVFPAESLLTTIDSDGEQIIYTICRDITRRKRAETESKKEGAFIAGQGRVLEMIATGAPLERILTNLLLLIEQQGDQMLCSILLLSEDGTHVRHGAAPSLPQAYVEAINGAPIGPKNGSCGTAMYLAKPVTVTDILEDPLWEDYKDLATQFGLRACWSTPILSGQGKVLGSFAMYYRQPQTPTGIESRLTDVATHIAGIAIEHQRAEQQLRSSEELFGKAFNANPNPMSLATLDEGRLIEVNESYIALSGYTRPELIGMMSFEHIWEMPLTRAELVRQVREQGLVRDIEAKIHTRSGASREVLLSSLAVEIGGQHCLLSVSNDITERRKAEEEVRLLQFITMEISLAQDLSSALEVVMRRVCQSTGWTLGQAWVPNEDGTVLECSSTWFSRAEGVEAFRLGSENTRLPSGIGLPGRVLQWKKPVWARDVTLDKNFPRAVLAIESGLKAGFAFPVIAAGQVIAVIEFFLREPKDEDDRFVKMISAIGTQLNVALERKRAEEQLRRAQADLAHASRVTTMGELAASIAHEVNQPLGAIVGNADICLGWLGGQGPLDVDQLRDAIEDIAADGRRASEVIARIRGLVKKNVPEPAAVNINDVAQEVNSLVEHEVQRKGVKLDVTLAPALPLVLGDRVQLQQVLLNLMMNGMEAMLGVEPDQRKLTVTTSVTKGDQVLVTVRDSGVGLKPDQFEQVFKPFHSTKESGMGMGLAISRSIVESHGGRLWAEPSRAPGATFKISLPAVASQS
jgi:PAS domain S-box-containing protein